MPGVSGMLDIIEKTVREKPELDSEAFEQALSKVEGGADRDGERYRAAMEWLGRAGGGIGRGNSIVREAVLKACKRPGALGSPPGHDGEPSDWHLPKGVRDLAALVCLDDDRFHGPIFTTNFDPLLELAIRDAGGHASTRWLDRDARLGGFKPDPGERQVIHLHGYWRESDTLNTPQQIEGERMQLRRSLAAELRENYRLVVVGYGGWNDVFTSALTELIREGEDVDVVWGFNETDGEKETAGEKVERRYAKLIEDVEPVLGSRFRAHGGIDVHEVFEEIAAKAGGQAIERAMQRDPLPPVRGTSPLARWEQVDGLFLDSLADLTDAEVRLYFDGAVPTWRHALSDAIPRRRHVERLLDALQEAAEQSGASSLHLIEAAAGEGKSTLLLQTAVDTARRDGWQVLARPTATIELDPDEIEALDPGVQWLLVADDAESLARRPNRNTPSDLEACAKRLHTRGRSNVHFLLAARDTDWKRFGRKTAWEDWLRFKPPPPLVLRGVNAADAEQIVSAWAQQGTEALGALAEVDAGERAETFRKAVKASGRGREDGSLFGGLLEARLGASGLRAHVRSLLARLQTDPVPGSTRTLYDALVFIAACHCGQGPGLSLNVLADLLGIDRAWVRSAVTRPLGEEAAAVGGAESARTRHPRVAEAIVAEVEEAFDTDLVEVWTAIVRQTIETSSDTQGGVERSSFNYIAHAGPKLARDLKGVLPGDRRREVAIAAAQAGVEAQPERLDAVVDLARTHREVGQPAEGAAVLRSRRDTISDRVDYNKVIRSYWYEWGTCEGEADNYNANAWIGGLSLSDRLNPAPVTDQQIKLSCAGLGVAFGKLAAEGDERFARALRAAAVVGMAGLEAEERQKPWKDHTARRYFTKHHKQANELKAPEPSDLAEAVAWLQAGVRAAHPLLEDEELASLDAPEAVSFLRLRARLGIADDIGGQPAAKLRPKKPRPPQPDRGPASTH